MTNIIKSDTNVLPESNLANAGNDIQGALIGHNRSAEARELEKNLNGNIILRPDGKIDFPKIGIKGAARLTSTEKIEKSRSSIQGGYNDGGVLGITYMNGHGAKANADNQGLHLFPAAEAKEKTYQLLDQLGMDGKEQAQALQILFGTHFSGYYDPYLEKWFNVGTRSYLGSSEMHPNGPMSTIRWDVNETDQNWNNEDYYWPFLAFEEC